MKKLFLLMVMCIGICLTANADSYRKTLDEYMQLGNTINTEQYEKVLTPLAEQLFSDDAVQATKAISTYMSKQLINDMGDIYEGLFRKYVTEEELKELIALYSDPRYAQIQTKIVDITANIKQTKEYAACVQQIEAITTAAMSCQPIPEDIPIKVNVSDEYREAFNRYYKQCNLEETIATSFKSMEIMLTKIFEKQNIANATTKVNTIMDCIKRNMETVYLTVIKESLTIDDLQLLTNAASLPAFQHVMKATAELSENPFQLSMKLFSNMANWMEANHPQYAAPIRNIVVEMEQLEQLVTK